MPRVDFQLWDRVYILKLICTAQATYSSFIVLVYVYLIVLQDWTTPEANRSDIMKFKWSVIVVSILEFGLGILLAFAANSNGLRCRKRILIWIISETFLIPVSIFLLMQLHKRITASNEYKTDPHYSRVNIAQVCFLLAQYIFIAYAIDFLVQGQRKAKTYDPSIRPKSVYAPTDPQITTTESRHIRMSQSLLFQPSSSKAFSKNLEKEGSGTSIEYFQKEVSECNTDGIKKGVEPESEDWKKNINSTGDTKAATIQHENKKIYGTLRDWAKDKKNWKDDDWMKEERTEWPQNESKQEREDTTDQEKEWTDDEKEWRRDDNYWMKTEMEETNTEKDREFEEKERIEWSDLEGKKEKETKEKDNYEK